MLQRNCTNYTLVLPTFEPPIEVPPGWEIIHDEPLAGFEPVQPPAAPAPDSLSAVDDAQVDPVAAASIPADQAPDHEEV